MSKNSKFSHSGKDRPQIRGAKPLDIYDRVNQVIIEKLEAGRMPWRSELAAEIAPANYLSKRSYTGINRLLLGCENYEHNYFLTFQQVTELGGRIRKGSKGHLVVFAKTLQYEEITPNGTPELRRSGMLRHYHVFNVSAVEGVDFKFPQVVKPNNPDEYAERIITELHDAPAYHFGKGTPHYRPDADRISMPRIGYFDNSEAYYCTFFHELVHATGHPKRLNRPELKAPAVFGSRTYSQEELTAEIGACYLSKFCGHDLTHTTLLDNSANYIAGWLSKLRNDRKFIFEAASKAQKAVDYILNHR